jgi:hypothetical protein
MSKQTDWEIYLPWPWTKIVYTDGTSERGPLEVMRRRAPDGRWQYRRMTKREVSNWLKWRGLDHGARL